MTSYYLSFRARGLNAIRAYLAARIAIAALSRGTIVPRMVDDMADRIRTWTDYMVYDTLRRLR